MFIEGFARLDRRLVAGLGCRPPGKRGDTAMAYQRIGITFEAVHPPELARWQTIPTSVASDAMNREGSMVGAIKPLAPTMRLAGQARTVSAMVGDNGIIHAAVALAAPGEVLVIDAGAGEDIAVWGEVLTRAARARRIQGIVLDGATRDAEAIRNLGFPVFCRAIAPRGPHKGFGGTIDGVVSVGGVAVRPGDLVLGDGDGVTIVPLGRRVAVLKGAETVIANEAEWIAAIETGKTTVEILGLPKAQLL